jgi:hypothetical protein
MTMTTSPTGVLPSGTETSCAARHGKGEAIQPRRRAYGHPRPGGAIHLFLAGEYLQEEQEDVQDVQEDRRRQQGRGADIPVAPDPPEVDSAVAPPARFRPR